MKVNESSFVILYHSLSNTTFANTSVFLPNLMVIQTLRGYLTLLFLNIFTFDGFCPVVMLSLPPLARRLEKDVKLVLDDICSDPAKKMALITGRQVELAEELSKILITDSFYFKLSFDQSRKNEMYWDG